MVGSNGIYHDNKRNVWCRVYKNKLEIYITNLNGDTYETYRLDRRSKTGFSDKPLGERYVKVSPQVVQNPYKFLQNEVVDVSNPDVRQVDVKYASLITGVNVSFFWDEYIDAIDTYSDRIPQPR